MKITLVTADHKEINLLKAQIEVTSNHLIDSGYAIDLNLIGKLPACRKAQVLSISHYFHGKGVSLSTLFEHRKFHNVTYETMKTLINEIPVVTKSYLNPVEITPEIKKMAREYLISLYGQA